MAFNKERENQKNEQLEPDRIDNQGHILTTNQGAAIDDNNNSLKAGERGPTLLEDFILREKIFHFDHERIPERIVHARGSGAHGVFKCYQSLSKLTSASFLADPEKETPVFVRFSTVAGSRGSTDLARDVRGFAVKFYTDEGVFDLVGNNIPVFFIQDAINFPDFVHAVKPEPDHEMPQAASAHDTFWDFVSLVPESAHMVMWAMSDRAVPRSYRMMEGFGVHTFRFINEQGESHFVKFHWKPLLGIASVAWDEAQKISGKDPDFHRRDLWENIEKGNYPEWELGLQVFTQEQADQFSFDVLDPTKLIPEELVPVQRVGKLTLNRNPDNFFAETEQVAFHPGHVVPGIDFSNDPLLQGRLFSYTDTQLSRLGSANFHELPINRSVAPVHNNQRDGTMRRDIAKGKASYYPNTVGGGCPYHAMLEGKGFLSFPEDIKGHKTRSRTTSFADHFTQARLFFKSQTPEEQAHIVSAFSFELGKVTVESIRIRYLGVLTQIDQALAQQVADNLGLALPDGLSGETLHFVRENHPGYPFEVPAPEVEDSPALSIQKQKKEGIATRRVAFLIDNGVSGQSIDKLKIPLEAGGAEVVFIAPKIGQVKTEEGGSLAIKHSFLTDASVLYDGLYVPGGQAAVTLLKEDPDFHHFVNEAYRHCKPLGFSKDAEPLLQGTYLKPRKEDWGLVLESEDPTLEQFVTALGKHRIWERENFRKVPA